jgi:hypothetical protein
MVKSATEAGAIPTFHYMDEVEVEGLLQLRRLLKDEPVLEGEQCKPAGTLHGVVASNESFHINCEALHLVYVQDM